MCNFHSFAITEGSFRISGSTSSTGRVEIFYNDQWGTICDHGWDMNDANVLCKQLGFYQALQAYTVAPIMVKEPVRYGWITWDARGVSRISTTAVTVVGETVIEPMVMTLV